MKLVFIGTPDFACPSLQAIYDDGAFDIAAVITQPNKPSGRGLALKEPPVRVLAKKLNLPILQPEKIKLALPQIMALKPEIIVVAAYAQIIPEAILSLPKYGCLNVHASLLPKYRGAGVIQAPILNNDSKSGVTIMLMDKTLDTGPILTQAEISLGKGETAGSLSDKLSALGAELLIPTINDWIADKIKPVAQDNSQASYVGLVGKQDGLVDWQRKAVYLERFVRAMSPWPGAWTWLKGRQVKIIEVNQKILPLDSYKPGKLFVYNNNLAVQCGEQALVIEKLKLAGKPEITGVDFINGHKDLVGLILG